MSSTKSFIVVNRRSPYASNFAKEALDVALMSAVFNQATTLLFMDEGVYQLLSDQDPSDISAKNSSATLPMLEMYEVKDIYVDSESLKQRGLSEEDLLIPAQPIGAGEIAELLQRQDIILNF